MKCAKATLLVSACVLLLMTMRVRGPLVPFCAP